MYRRCVGTAADKAAWPDGDDGPRSEEDASAYSDEYDSGSEFFDGVGSGGEGSGAGIRLPSPGAPGRRPRGNSVTPPSLNDVHAGSGVDDGTSSTGSTLGTSLPSPGLVGTSLRLRAESAGGSWRSFGGAGGRGGRRGGGSAGSLNGDEAGASKGGKHRGGSPPPRESLAFWAGGLGCLVPREG